MIEALLVILTRLVTGTRANVLYDAPESGQCIYYANHTSNLDALLIWASLPKDLRKKIRPVAAEDYWGVNPLRRYIAVNILNAVLINRKKVTRENNPVERIVESIKEGYSIIIFPEGTRSETELPIAFKSGLYKIIQAIEGVALVPVWIDNANRVLPKGELLPVPIICSITIGPPIVDGTNMAKAEFLKFARAELIKLKDPDYVD